MGRFSPVPGGGPSSDPDASAFDVTGTTATITGQYGSYFVTNDTGIVTLTIDPSAWAVGSSRQLHKANTGAFSIVLTPPALSTINGGAVSTAMTLPGSEQDGSAARGDMSWTVTRLTATTYRVSGGSVAYSNENDASVVDVFTAKRLVANSGLGATSALVQLTNTVGSADTFICSGSPEGVITAGIGARAIDITGRVFIKRTGAGNTGWQYALTQGDITALISTADPLSAFSSFGTIGVTSRYTDFNTTSTGNYPYSAFGLGTGNAQNWFSAYAGRSGLITMETGTDATGQYFVGTNTSAVSLGFGTYRWRSDLYIPTLSDATDDFTTRIGFIDATGGECVDGCYFRQNHAVNGGRWQFVTRSNNVEAGSATDTGVTPSTSVLQAYEIEVNAAGTQAIARIDGVVVATNVLNIPTGVARATGVGLQIKKAAGTNTRRLIVDLMGDRFDRSVMI